MTTCRYKIPETLFPLFTHPQPQKNNDMKNVTVTAKVKKTRHTFKFYFYYILYHFNINKRNITIYKDTKPLQIQSRIQNFVSKIQIIGYNYKMKKKLYPVLYRRNKL
jgi:hypothetical protein